jgi:hypothetical protein
MTADNRINYINIGLMFISCIAAFIMPFEVFLFAYAFMGPLHYLTEISWLHDRNYFTKGKYDFWVLVSIGVLISFFAAAQDFGFASDFVSWFSNQHLYGKLLALGLFGAVVMAFVKNHLIKIISLFLLFVFVTGWFTPNAETTDGEPYLKETKAIFVITSLVPTLIHVYIFTLLFMLFGALKSRSKTGLLSVCFMVICPLLLYFLFQDKSFAAVSSYGKEAYYANGHGFWDLNLAVLQKLNVALPMQTDSLGNQLYYTTGEPAINTTPENIFPVIFYSKPGILLQRFIAFAYTYHYLNWFSKTEIIRWHQVPKVRFIVVIALWVGALVAYAINYSLGLKILFFLSFCHVLLEFPLNWTSMVGIVKESRSIISKGFSKPAAAK